MEVYIALTIVLIGIWLYRRYQYISQFPPGPFSLPLIGSLLHLKDTGSDGIISPKFHKYGNLVTFFMGSHPLILINNFKITKDLFSRDEFLDKKHSWWTRNVRGNNGKSLGIINSDGKTWQTQRRFSLRLLRDFGFGKRSVDFIIQREAKEVCEKMLKEASNSNDVYMESNFAIPSLNVIWQLVSAQRFDSSNPDTCQDMKDLAEIFKAGFPILHYLPYLRFIWKGKRYRTIMRLKNIIRRQIKEHRNTRDENNPRDFIDVYLNEIESDDKQSKDFHSEQLVTLCLDFFQAGAETSSTTLMWCVHYMALYPEAQKRCRAEIRKFLSDDEPPTRETGSLLLYTNATIMEIQRISSLIPTSLTRSLERDMNIEGYSIPKGTEFVSNFTLFHKDESYFAEPEKFYPERFLNEDGDGIKKIEYFLPFGIGKRMCMGESLARSTVFITFVMLLQSMEIHPPDNHDSPDPKKAYIGITRVPKEFYVKVKPIATCD